MIKNFSSKHVVYFFLQPECDLDSDCDILSKCCFDPCVRSNTCQRRTLYPPSTAIPTTDITTVDPTADVTTEVPTTPSPLVTTMKIQSVFYL